MIFRTSPLGGLQFVAALAILVTLFSGCGEDAVSSSSDPESVPGDVGEMVTDITGALDEEQSLCIEAAESAAEAVADCNDGEQLTEQVMGVLDDFLEDSGTVGEDREAVAECLEESLDDLDSDDIDELAAVDSREMGRLGDDLMDCFLEKIWS